MASQPRIRDILIHTGQHFDDNMSEIFFRDLEIPKPEHHLGIGGGTHGQNTGRMVEKIETVLLAEKPDRVVVYGDTDSTLAGALAAVKLGIPLAHVEAGLRSFNRRMPEEINRVLTDHAADLLFAPTGTAVENLAAEGIRGSRVRQVGDVMYDATLFFRDRARRPNQVRLEHGGAFVLCTIHRAENTDDPHRLSAIVRLVNRVAATLPVVLPLHPRTAHALENPVVEKFSKGVQVTPPLGFLETAWLLRHCRLLLTDSGGMQKEAYFHGKPCVTLREETEWVELVKIGANRLVSPESGDALVTIHQAMETAISSTANLYGDGRAGNQIVRDLLEGMLK
jgi:UDP-GlcNAc3NAcA epimerase